MGTFLRFFCFYIGRYAHKFFSFDFLTYIYIKKEDIFKNQKIVHQAALKKCEGVKNIKHLQEFFDQAEKEIFKSDQYYKLSEHDKRIFNALYSREYNLYDDSIELYLEYIKVMIDEKNGKISSMEAIQDKVNIINKMSDFKKVLLNKYLMILALVEMQDNFNINLMESILFEKNLIPNQELIKNRKKISDENSEMFYVYVYEMLLKVKEYQEIDSEVDEYGNLPKKKDEWNTEFDIKGMLENLFNEDSLTN